MTLPSRLELGGGAWIALRRPDGVDGKGVITDEAGRFLVLDAVESGALVAGSPAGDDGLRSRLDALGFVRRDRESVTHEISTASAPRHVLHVASADGVVMSDAIARAIVDRIFESSGRWAHIELRGEDPLVHDAIVRLVVERAREKNRGSHRRLSFGIVTNLSAMSAALCDWFVERGVSPTVRLEGDRDARAAPERWIGTILECFARHGIDATASYVNALVPVTRDAIAAGADVLVDRLVRLGVAYVHLQPSPTMRDPQEFNRFQREAIRRIVDVNVAGTILIEKRFALYLETIASLADPRRPAAVTEQLVYGADGTVYAREVGPLLAQAGDRRFAIGHVDSDTCDDLARRALDQMHAERSARDRRTGCAACAYDRFCAASLVRQQTMDDDLVTQFYDSSWCRRSMGTLDDVFTWLASERSATLRAVFRSWSAARDRVAARLAAIKD